MKLSFKRYVFDRMLGALIHTGQILLEDYYPNAYFYVTELYRSPDRQLELFKANLSKTLKSKHLLGLAADIAVIDNGTYSKDHHLYTLLGEYWESIGGVWGGRWSIGGGPDLYHFEIGDVASIKPF